MSAGPKRAERDIAVINTPENLYTVANAGGMFFSLTAFNDTGIDATIKASIGTSGTHGTHKLCPDDLPLDDVSLFEITGRVAENADVIVVESSVVGVTFCMTARLEN